MNLPGVLSLAAGDIREEAIIVEILLALPVKSLIRFKCVCKSWRTFISDPHFARSHLNRCMLQNPNSSQRLLFRLYDRADGQLTMRSLDYERCNFDDVLRNSPVISSLPLPIPRICTIISSCDGLVCLRVYTDFPSVVIWNPTTGEWKDIQPPANFELLGFGYDPASDDYKILIRVPTGGDDYIHIFSLKDKSWRKLCRVTKEMAEIFQVYGVYLNGCLHWLTIQYEGGISNCIWSFDLSKEKFEKVIPLPDGIPTYDCPSKLTVLRGCLCLPKIDLLHKCYIMGEYGLKSSWTEFQLPEVETAVWSSQPLCITTDGKVLGVVIRMLRTIELYLYSMEHNSCQFASIKDLVIDDHCLYVESLVSLAME